MAGFEESLAAEHLMKCYSLNADDTGRVISDTHLDQISRFHSRQWKSLPPYLAIESIIADDLSHYVGEEHEKRLSFFLKWKQMKGSDATYFVLISALLKIKCKQDAEGVCKLLEASLDKEVIIEEPHAGKMCAVVCFFCTHNYQQF